MKKTLLLLLLLRSVLACGQTDQPAVAQPRINYYVETARPAEEIAANYPYDIPLRNAEGDTLVSSQAFEKNGKPTVLLFWLTTCQPCRMELKAIAEKYAGWQAQASFNLYAVSTDFPRNFENYQHRVTESKWPFPAYFDLDREFSRIMPGNLNGLPQVFVLDGEGNITSHKRKYAPGDEDQLFEEIMALVKG